MKVRVIKPFVDVLDKTITHKVDEVLDLDKNRVENAVKLGYVETIAEEKAVATKRTKK